MSHPRAGQGGTRRAARPWASGDGKGKSAPRAWASAPISRHFRNTPKQPEGARRHTAAALARTGNTNGPGTRLVPKTLPES